MRIMILLFSVASLAAQSSIDQRVRGIDGYVREVLPQWAVPGLALAIVYRGEVVLAQGYGVRRVDSDDAVDQHTLFAIASNTKAFTAAALAMQVDAGRLEWDDRVIDHLPYFQVYDAYATREMRVRDLLCHRSGLGTFSGDLLWYGTGYDPAEVIRRVRFLEPTSSFRSRYGYSNLMFIAAGEVLGAVSGQPWPQFVSERILKPLGMDETLVSVDQLSDRANVAIPHKLVDNRAIPVEWVNWDSMAAAGGIISSVHDMSRWLQLQLGKGQLGIVTLFSEKQHRTMWASQMVIPVSERSQQRFPSTHFRAYGLGWGLMDYRSHKVIQHGGGYDGMYSRVTLIPEAELGIVVLTNSMTGLQTALCYRIIDVFLKAKQAETNDSGSMRDWSTEFATWSEESRERQTRKRREANAKRQAGTRPSLELSQYAGTYGGELYGDARVELVDDKLVLRLLPNPDLVADLSHWHYNTFSLKWRKTFAWFGDGRVQFVIGPYGEVQQLKIDVPNQDLFFDELTFMRR